ncbi:transcription factor E2F3 isoform X1, partial [Lates japonicus]
MRKGLFSVPEDSVYNNAAVPRIAPAGGPSALPEQVRFAEPTDRLAFATPPGPATSGSWQKPEVSHSASSEHTLAHFSLRVHSCVHFPYFCGNTQSKRRLELEVSYSQDPQDGGRPAKAMSSLFHTEDASPAPHPITYTSTLKRSRDDTSLSFLTRRFAELLSRSADGVLDLNVVSQELSAPKRRVYDVTNVLEGIQLIKKKSKNNIQW